MKLMKESVILICVAVADLATTLLLLRHGQASEGNPLMDFYLKRGVGAFILVKLALVVLPIFIVEWSKLKSPRFARALVRFALAAYIGVYIGLFLGVNVRPTLARPNPSAPVQHIRVSE